MEIGEKIKSLRKKKGLTQAQLAGDIVTRNMLSLIESGSARPSLQTTKAFEEKLGVPVEYLISDSESEASYCKMDSLKSIKEFYQAKNYTECLERALSLGDCDDEISLIMMRCCLHLGESALKKREMRTANIFFKKAVEHSVKTIYAEQEEKARISIYFSMTDSIISRKSFAENTKVSIRECDEIANYISAVNGADIGDIELLPDHKIHVAIMKLMKTGRYSDAKRAIFDQLKIVGDKLTKYLLLTTLEDCFRKSGDFKGAIESASEKRAAYAALME